jgi:hypothetical protein
MSRRTPHPSHPAPRAPQGCPDPDVLADVETLRTHLRLARAQNGYLHRELATALKPGPLAPRNGDDSREALAAENASLRERLTLLSVHHKDLQHRYEALRWEHTHFGARAPQDSDGWGQPSLVPEPVELMSVLTTLLALCHPDRWHGQPATALAHEICVALNAAREKLEGAL